MSNGRIVCWFSCGAASAVATKIAVERYSKEREIAVCYCDTSRDEHPDNMRFMRDVENWLGVKVRVLSHPKYKTVTDAWIGEGYVSGIYGASCTRTMKRELREAFQRPDDTHVLGLCADESERIAKFDARHKELNTLWVLQILKLTKRDCFSIIQGAGIKLPEAYLLGYNNANCIGCCKGGQGYWNKVREDFPEIFEQRKQVFREIGCNPFKRDDGTRFGLDELTPDMGRDTPEPEIDCGLFCADSTNLIQIGVEKLSEVKNG